MRVAPGAHSETGAARCQDEFAAPVDLAIVCRRRTETRLKIQPRAFCIEQILVGSGHLEKPFSSMINQSARLPGLTGGPSYRIER